MYGLFHSPFIIDIITRVLETPDVSLHGIFNLRMQAPDEQADGLMITKWHQDGQFWFLDYGGPEPDTERKTHVVTLWIPTTDVDESSGCLQVFSTEETGNKLFEVYDHDYQRTGTVGLSPEDAARYTPIAAPMKRGDVLIITQRSPHAAVPMTVDRLRWSFDARFEATEGRTVHGRKYGMILQSQSDPASVTPLEEWLKKQEKPNP